MKTKILADFQICISVPLTSRNDQRNKKAKEINAVLSRECNKRNICVIKHDNMNTRRHCYMSDLHLN